MTDTPPPGALRVYLVRHGETAWSLTGQHSATIGRHPVPVEILPFARRFVLAEIEKLGGAPTLRMTEGQPARSDQDNLLADCAFAELADPAAIKLNGQNCRIIPECLCP
jgi:ribose 5-phosphate isomerase